MKKITTLLFILLCFTELTAYCADVTKKRGNFQYTVDKKKLPTKATKYDKEGKVDKMQYPATGCCSGHGGVKACSWVGYYICKDSTLSDKCKCKKERE